MIEFNGMVVTVELNHLNLLFSNFACLFFQATKRNRRRVGLKASPF